MQELSGVPGVKDTVTPLGSVSATTTRGIICVLGETKRGELGKNYLIGSWPEFVRKLGGLHIESDFALQCKEALDGGSRLRVARAFHLANIDQAATVDGDLAEGDLDNDAVLPVAAKAQANIQSWTGSGSNLSITLPDPLNPSQTLSLANYNGIAAQTRNQAATAVVAFINGNTGTNGFSAIATGPQVEIIFPAEYGSLANSWPITFTPTLAVIDSYSASFSGGAYVGGAYVGATLATWTGNGSNFNLGVQNLNGTGNITLVDYDGLNSETIPSALLAIRTAVNAETVNTGYTALLAPANKIYFVKSTASGASGNGLMATLNITAGTVTNANWKFSNGSTSYGALTSTWTAKAVGDGYNGSVITITPSSNGKADMVDITVALTDSDLPQVIKGIKRTLTTQEQTSLNKQLEGVEFSNLANDTLPIGTVTLDGGTQDLSLIDDNDYIGSAISKTGYHAFDDVTDAMRIANISRPTHGAALGLSLYLSARKDMRGRTYVPKGLTIQGVEDFRLGTGPYSHQPLDNWLIDLWQAELNVTDPNNVNVTDYVINGGGFQCATRSLADNQAGPWYSDSGNDYGKIAGANGMRMNLGAPGYNTQYGNLYDVYGVNAIIVDDMFGVVNWGNRTTLLDRTSLLNKANIADLVVYIAREVKRIARAMNFKPNDIAMFNLLYRKVVPFITDTLVSGRAIEGDATPTRGEGKWWHWIGDQNAKDLNGLVLNTKDEVQQGKYRCRFAFCPIASNEYIGLDIAPTDSTTILNVAQLTNLNG